MNMKRMASWKTTDGLAQTRDDKLIKGTTAVRLLTFNDKSQWRVGVCSSSSCTANTIHTI